MQQKRVEIELQCQRPEQQIKQDKKKQQKTQFLEGRSTAV